MLKKIYTFGYVLLFSLFFLGKAIADPLIIEDFDDISGWSNGLTLETSNIKAGTGAALWGDTETYQYLNRSFNAPIDLTAYNQFTFWVHSDAANNALIEIIFTSSGGYFRHQMQVDWLGWRAVSVHKKDFKISKPTASWASIDKFGFNSSGWGHEPTPGTRLIFDDVRFTLSPVTNIQKQVQYVNGDYVFNFSVLVNNPSLLSRTFNIVPGEQNDTSINITATNSIVTLLPDESGSFNISVTIPQNIIDPAKALDLLRAEFQLYEGDVLLEGIRLPSHMPLAERSFPRTFLNAADFERMNLWAADATLPWATKAKNDIISQADGWRAKFNTKYGVDWYVPSGGQWGGWYVSPDTHYTLTYLPLTQTHIDLSNDTVWTGAIYDDVIYGRMHKYSALSARQLGIAYRLTTDNIYAEEAATILLAYADQYASMPLHDSEYNTSQNSGRVLAQVLEEATWLIDIAWAYDLIADSTALTDANRLHIENDLLRIAREVIIWSGAPNQQSLNNTAIAAVGFAIQDAEYISTAIKGNAGFEKQMALYVNSDGIWKEGSWGYHFYALEPLTKLAEMSLRAGYNLFTQQPTFELMFSSASAFAMPNYKLPAFGDGHEMDLLLSIPWMEPAYKHYGDGSYNDALSQINPGYIKYFWGSNQTPVATLIKPSSVLFDDSGYAVLKSVNNYNVDSYVAMRFGPSVAHDHQDKLSFISYANGIVNAVDPGVISYGSNLNAKWYQQTLAHNTVVVDQTSQVDDNKGVLHRYTQLPSFSMIAADAGESSPNTKLLRTMVVTPDYTLDRFHASATDGTAKIFDWVYHNDGIFNSSLIMNDFILDVTNESGYEQLAQTKNAITDTDWSASFINNGGWFKDWINLKIERAPALVKQGVSAGLWDGHTIRKSISKSFATSQDFSSSTQVEFWMYSAVANNALIDVIIESDAGEKGYFRHRLEPINWTGWKPITLNLSDFTQSKTTIDWTQIVSFGLNAEGWSKFAKSDTSLIIDQLQFIGGTNIQPVDDFDRVLHPISLRQLAEVGTNVISASGKGQDLDNDIPLVISRRISTDTTFVTSIEHYTGNQKIQNTQLLNTSALSTDEVLALEITTDQYIDSIFAMADGELISGTERTFGLFSCDGSFCLSRLDLFGGLKKLMINEASVVNHNGQPIFASTQPIDAQIEFEGDNITVSGLQKNVNYHLEIIPTVEAIPFIINLNIDTSGAYQSSLDGQITALISAVTTNTDTDYDGIADALDTFPNEILKPNSQGWNISHVSDFSDVTVVENIFEQGETLHLLVWSDAIDFNNLRGSPTVTVLVNGVEHSFDLANNLDYTYSGQIVLNSSLVGADSLVINIKEKGRQASSYPTGAIAITVLPLNGDAKPVVNILSPATGDVFDSGVPVNFTASATDVEDDDSLLTAALLWNSSLQGNLSTGGSGGNFNYLLQDGDHLITATATDSAGNVTISSSVNITVGTISIPVCSDYKKKSTCTAASCTWTGSGKNQFCTQ